MGCLHFLKQFAATSEDRRQKGVRLALALGSGVAVDWRRAAGPKVLERVSGHSPSLFA